MILTVLKIALTIIYICQIMICLIMLCQPSGEKDDIDYIGYQTKKGFWFSIIPFYWLGYLIWHLILGIIQTYKKLT